MSQQHDRMSRGGHHVEDSRLRREPIADVLAAAAIERGDRPHLSWAGWAAHDGRLGEVADPARLERTEQRLGRLPEDYRSFLLRVAADGAGPGYGLVSPWGSAQARLARGLFDWRNEEEPPVGPAGAILLAHAGCGVVWLLVLNGPSRGEVWVDATGSDGLVRRAAPSFDAWYRHWLGGLRGGHPFTQWDPRCCATRSVLGQLVASIDIEGHPDPVAEVPRRLGPGSIGLSSGGGAYFAEGSALDPCHACSDLVRRFHLGLDVFRPGIRPRQARRTDESMIRRLLPWGR